MWLVLPFSVFNLFAQVVCLREKKKEGESEGSPEYCAERVLGIHITGPNTGEVLQGFTVALRLVAPNGCEDEKPKSV